MQSGPPNMAVEPNRDDLSVMTSAFGTDSSACDEPRADRRRAAAHADRRPGSGSSCLSQGFQTAFQEPVSRDTRRTFCWAQVRVDAVIARLSVASFHNRRGGKNASDERRCSKNAAPRAQCSTRSGRFAPDGDAVREVPLFSQPPDRQDPPPGKRRPVGDSFGLRAFDESVNLARSRSSLDEPPHVRSSRCRPRGDE